MGGGGEKESGTPRRQYESYSQKYLTFTLSTNHAFATGVFQVQPPNVYKCCSSYRHIRKEFMQKGFKNFCAFPKVVKLSAARNSVRIQSPGLYALNMSRMTGRHHEMQPPYKQASQKLKYM
jgi:hypothetical protein